MDTIEALILGLVQGLTEFLPVSSSGHLAIAKSLFGIRTDDLSFEITVHAATVLATVVVFRHQILDLLKGLLKRRYNSQTRYVCMIVVSMVPVFIVGMFFKDYVEELFGSGLPVVGCALILTAFLLFLSDILTRRRTRMEVEGVSGKHREHGINYAGAVWMGIAQAFAVIPGLSRSGSTIAAGLISGVRKEDVAQFSFLMVLVPVLGEAFLDLVDGGFASSTVGTFQLAVGFVSAFVSGLFACKFMIAVVRRASLKWFSLYCILAAVLCFCIEFCA